jgi:hypothetical protein
MSRFSSQAPWEFLLSASRTTLQSYELSRLAHAANLRKEIAELLDQWMTENTSANLARWLIDQRERTVGTPPVEPGDAPVEPQTASYNISAERSPLPRTPRVRT